MWSREQLVETTSWAVRVFRPSRASSECSRWSIQTFRPSTMPAKSHWSSRPSWFAMNSALWRPPCSWASGSSSGSVDRPGEVQADALDRQVAEDAVGVPDVVEVGLDEDPRALVHLAELLVGEAEGVELTLSAVLDEAGLVELHPGRALLGQPLDHLAVDLDERLDQIERVEALGSAVGGLGEQQEADRADQDRDRVDTELLHRLGVLVEGLGARQRELRVGAELGDDVVVVRVEPLGHLHRGGVLAPASHGEIGVQVHLSTVVAVSLGHGADQGDRIEHLVVVGEVVRGDQIDPGVLHQLPVLHPDRLGRGRQLVGGLLAPPVALSRELELAIAADARESGDVGEGHASTLPRPSKLKTLRRRTLALATLPGHA